MERGGERGARGREVGVAVSGVVGARDASFLDHRQSVEVLWRCGAIGTFGALGMNSCTIDENAAIGVPPLH